MKCIDCAWYPWVPGADVSMLPAMKCSPKLSARRWTPEGVAVGHECPEFRPKNNAVVEQASPDNGTPEAAPDSEVRQNDPDGGTPGEAPEAPKRTNSGRRK